MSTIGNLTAATQAQSDAVDTVIPAENGAANATVKITTLQLLFSMLRPSKLSVVATNLLTNGTLLNVEDPTFAAPLNRQITLAQMNTFVRSRTGQIYTYQPRAKVGTTAGWVIDPASNLWKMATIPAGVAAGTLVIPIPFYKIGAHIRNAFLNGSIQSGGNAGTLLLDLRMLTVNAAGAVDSSLSVMGAALNVVANTIVSAANSAVPTIDHVVAAGESYYALVTSTTGAAVTEELQNISLTVDEV